MSGFRLPRLVTRLSLLAVVAFAIVGIGLPLVGVRVFHASDMLLARAPWKSEMPAGFTPGNSCVSDTVDAVVPADKELTREAGQGDIPLWNPLASGGSPFASVPNNAFLSPLSLPYYVLPTWMAPAYVKVLEILVAAGGMLLFVRRLGGSTAAGLLGGLAFVSSGFMVTWTNWPQTRTAAFIPALFWAVERFIQMRTARGAVPVALVVASMLASGFPAVTGYALYGVAVYAVLRIGWTDRRAPKAAVRGFVVLGVAVALGAALMAVQLLSFTNLLHNYDVLGARQQSPQAHLPGLSLVTTAFPLIFGSCGHGHYFGPFVNEIEENSYIGAAALVLVVIALFRPMRWLPRGVRWFFVAAAAVTVVLGWYGGTPLAIAQKFPVFSSNPVYRIRSMLGFFLAVLVAFGFDAVARARRSSDTDTPDTLPRRSRWSIVAEVIGWVAAAVITAVLVRRAHALAVSRHTAVYQTKELWLPVAGGAVALIAVLLAGYAARRSGRSWQRTHLAAVAVLPVIVLVQALQFVLPFWSRIPRSQFYPTTPVHSFLAAHLGHERYGASGITMWPGTNVFYGLRCACGHTFTETGWRELMKTADPHSFLTPTFSTQDPGASLESVQSPIFDRIGEKYFVTAPEQQVYGRPMVLNAGSGQTVMRDGNTTEEAIPGSGLRAVGVRLTGAPTTHSSFASLDVAIVDGSGKVLASASRRVFDRPGRTFLVPIAAEGVHGDKLHVRITPHGLDLPVGADQSGRPELTLVLPQNDGLSLVFTDGAEVWQRTTALPRIRWASRSRVIADKVQRLATLDNDRSIPDTVILSAPGPAGDGRPADVHVDKDEPDQIDVTVDAKGAGYVVVGDALQDEWHATLDGHPAQLRDADHGLVAVEVPSAGKHVIRLNYSLPSAVAGTSATTVSAVVLVLAFFLPWGRRRFRRSGEAGSYTESEADVTDENATSPSG